MNDLQKAILEMMNEIHNICVSNDIKYFMVGGTMLGAIRHKGFIPWDDDIDIAMPRKDFERFMSLPQCKYPDWMEIKAPEDNCVNMGYIKVMNRNTTIVEDYKGVRVGGIFIDVFPLDGIFNDYRGALKRMKKIKFETFMFRAHQGLANTESIFRKFFGGLSKISSLKFLYSIYLKSAKKYDFYQVKFVANTVGVYGVRELQKREVFGEPTLYKFENYEFFGVENADIFLKDLYGDYMELPPEEKRVSQHGVKYLNLNMPYREYRDREEEL